MPLIARIAALILSACACGLGPVSGEEINLRLQIDWQSPKAKTWEGRVSIDQGQFSGMELLGFDAATPGSVILRRLHLLVHQTAKQKYNGAIVSVTGDEQATLRFEFIAGGETKASVFSIGLKSLVDLTDRAKSFEVDSAGSRISVRRVPGDQIRVALNRPNLVFSPRESWTVDVSPNHLSVADLEPRECRFDLVDADGDRIWSKSESFQSAVGGKVPTLRNIAIDVPATEGVYMLKIKLSTPVRRLPPFRSEKTLAERALQFVVIAPQRPEDIEVVDRLVSEFDPAEHRWWDRLKLLPQWSILPGLRNDGSLSNLKTTTIRHNDANWVSIPTDGWQAFPLPVDDLNQRHELTIEYPGDLPQTTTFSIVEPDASGKVLPIGLDSGVHVDREDVFGVAARPPKEALHTIPFWPSTKSPLLLITNVDPDLATVVGRISVSQKTMPSPSRSFNRDQRKLIANFDRPLFLENFSAIERTDNNGRRSFEDWSTFYDGGRRMIEHLRQSGFDAVSLSCYAEGSSLYPDEVNHPTPKYDRGVFFSDGRDPVRKDVLEMLFRICDRESVSLIPSFEFSTKLHGLELAARDVRSIEGIRLVNNHGKTFQESQNGISTPTAIYNPLDSRVQQAILSVIRDVAKRYSRHPSFGGVKLHLTRNSFTQLPGVEWGMDRSTLRRFRQETSAKIRDPMKDLPGARMDTLSPAIVEGWKSWRCGQLADFYGRLREMLLREANRGDVYLSTTDLLNGDSLSVDAGDSLIKSINVNDELRDLGIDLQLLAKKRGLIVPQPRRMFANTDLLTQAVDIELSHSDDIARRFGAMPVPATQFHHQPVRKHLETFDALSPFGKDKTYLSLVAHVTPSGAPYRERFAHALARNDSLMLMDGGWMLPLGQEKAMQAFAATYRSLPAVRFKSIGSEAFRTRIRPLTVRKLVYRGESYYYVVNDSPWNVGVDLRFQSKDRSLTMRSLGVNRTDRLEPTNDAYEWSINVRPYELVAVAMSSDDVTLIHGQSTLPPDVGRGLEERITALMSRARYLGKPVEYTKIANGDFEASSQNISSWQPDANGRSNLAISAGFESPQSMRATVGGKTASIRSAPFVSPESNRLAVQFLAKSMVPKTAKNSKAANKKDPRPGLRIVVERNGSEIVGWETTDFRTESMNQGWLKVILPVHELPVQKQGTADGGPRDLTLRFDVLPDADVQIDDVRVFDTLLLNADELRALSNKKISLPDYMRRKGFYGDCNRFLNSYWPQYLMRFIPEATEAPPVMTRRSVPRRKPVRTSDRLKRYIPRLPGFR